VASLQILQRNLPGKTGKSHEKPQENQYPGQYPKELSPNTSHTKPPHNLIEKYKNKVCTKINKQVV
jgi:hypothetical protein